MYCIHNSIKFEQKYINMKVILENTWNEYGEAQDIINYCTDNDIECLILTPSEILNKKDFFDFIFFCSTDIVQKQLQSKQCLFLVPDTYDDMYSEFYCRKIEKIKFKDIVFDEKMFIKPVGNNKHFNGIIVESKDDFKLNCEDLPNDDDVVYKSEIVKFVSEYRLLIGNKLYGYGHIGGEEMDIDFHKMDLINKLIELTGNNFNCIDIGYIESTNSWTIVEINPPFSLDDYGIEINDYMEFCIDSCKHINKIVTSQLSSLCLQETN